MATFDRKDFSRGPGMRYEAALYRDDGTGTLSQVLDTTGQPMVATVSHLTVTANFSVTDIPSAQRSGEFSVRVKLCASGPTPDGMSTTPESCGSHGPAGSKKVTLP